jgi:hypothetical protein
VFFVFRSTLNFISLPDDVLVVVLSYIPLQDLLTYVNRTCKRLNDLIKTKSSLWRHFEFDWELNVKYGDLCEILNHAASFTYFLLPQGSVINCPAPDIDFIFLTRFVPARHLYWICLTDVPISTLSFIKYIPNLQIVNLTGCYNLRDEDFLVLRDCKELDQIYVSFTDIKPKTLSEIITGKQVIVLDACGVEFDIHECKTIVSPIFGSLLSFSLSLKADIETQDFNHQIIDYFIDTQFHIYLK